MVPGDNAKDAGLSAKVRIIYTVIKRIHTEMANRFKRLKHLDDNFGFLLDVQNIKNIDVNDLKGKCASLGGFYSDDVNGQELLPEIEDCEMLLASRSDALVNTPRQFVEFVIPYGGEVLPNLRAVLQIAVSIAGCERSFSKQY